MEICLSVIFVDKYKIIDINDLIYNLEIFKHFYKYFYVYNLLLYCIIYKNKKKTK